MIHFLIASFLSKNNILIDSKEIEIQLLTHPHYPSLNCVTDLFSYFNINNAALDVPITYDSLKELPSVFLAVLNKNKKEILVIVEQLDDMIILTTQDKKKEEISKKSFLNLWSGVIIIVENNAEITVFETTKIKHLNTILLGIIVVGVSAYFLKESASLFQQLHFLFSVIGFGVSVIIVQHELGLNSVIGDKFCAGASKKLSCDAVLNSKGATIYKNINLSDVGVIYFFSLIVSWLLFIISSSNSNLQFNAMAILSVCVIPFSFYSVYYQWIIVKVWCPLCLSIVGVLWFQLFTVIYAVLFVNNLFTIDTYFIGFLCIGFGVSTLIWFFLQPLLKHFYELKMTKLEYMKFKRNFKLFNAMLQTTPVLDTAIPNIQEIVFGHKRTDVSLNILLITNPMCGHCKEMHSILEKIMQQEYEDVQITIRFNIQTNTAEASSLLIASQLLYLYHSKGESVCLEALHDIYGVLDADSWLKKWNKHSENSYQTSLEKQKEWCTINKLNFTPALLLNGMYYPKEYKRGDVLYFIDDLIETYTKNNPLD